MKLYDSKEFLVEQIKTKTYLQIAEENDTSIKTIFRRIKKFGLSKPVKKWDDYELGHLKKHYGENRDFFNELKGRSLSSIYHKASRINTRRIVKPLNYRIDETFFDKWTNELAYFLGFFVADGYINIKKQKALIKIQKRDEYILNKFLKLLKTNRPIRYQRGYPQLMMSNSLIVKKLIKLGCKPGDSINNAYPKDMPDKYFFHFLRGYIDGDGSIFIGKSKISRQKNVLRVSIFGSKQFLELLKRKISYFLNEEINYKIRKCHANSEVLWGFTLNSKLARMLCYRLYKDCNNLCLKRKREKFNNHIKNLK